MTAMQAIVKQIAFAAMILGTMVSETCIFCSISSAGLGMVAMLSGKQWIRLLYPESTSFFLGFSVSRFQRIWDYGVAKRSVLDL